MATAILLGVGLAAVTVVIHATGTTWWIARLSARPLRSEDSGDVPASRLLRVLILTAIVVLLLHIVEVIVWALVYHWLPETPALTTFDDAVYFSMVTFTTLGYGDIVLSGGPRLLAGIEAMVGILHFGWSTALMFSVVQQLLRLHAGPGSSRTRQR